MTDMQEGTAFISPVFYRHYPRAWDIVPTLKEHTIMTTTRTLPGTGIPTPPAVAASRDAYLHQSTTTTPSYPNLLPNGAVPSLQPNPGMLRALLQPVIFFTLTEPVDAYEAGDTVALQFWGEGRVMVTPLPAEAARGRIPTTFPANKLHGFIAVPRHA
jgi:hypothetical protein